MPGVAALLFEMKQNWNHVDLSSGDKTWNLGCTYSI